MLSTIPRGCTPIKQKPLNRRVNKIAFYANDETTSSFHQRSSLMAGISRGLRFLPLLWSLLLIVNVITSSLISNVSHTQDYVGTSGFLLAQSLFSELLDLLALVGLASIIVRYLHLEMVTRDIKGELYSIVSRLRLASLSFGIGSMLGITLTSNFRQPIQQVSWVVVKLAKNMSRIFSEGITRPGRERLEAMALKKIKPWLSYCL